MNQISLEPLNRFAPKSLERCVWSLARTSLNVKVKVTRDKMRCALPSPPEATEWNTLVHITSFSSSGTILLLPGVISATCLRLMFGKTSLL